MSPFTIQGRYAGPLPSLTNPLSCQSTNAVSARSPAASSMRLTPLRTWQWMLLAVGLSQVHVVAAAFVVIWLHVLAWRERRPELGIARFNMRQMLVAFMTFVSIIILIVAVKQGLLGHPDMQVRGNGSFLNTLVWFEDRAAPSLTAPLVVSAPMMVYRGAMLAWALWMSLSFLAWLRWGFAAFGPLIAVLAAIAVLLTRFRRA